QHHRKRPRRRAMVASTIPFRSRDKPKPPDEPLPSLSPEQMTATVKRVGGSVRREVRDLCDDPSHGLSPRSRGALLGFGDAREWAAASSASKSSRLPNSGSMLV